MMGINILNRLRGQRPNSPNDSQMHLSEGVRLANDGLHREAVVQLKRAVQADPSSAEAQFELGLVFQIIGQPEQAITAYLAALAIRSDLVNAYKNLGAVYDGLGHFLKALKVYTKAIILAPTDPELRNDLGRAFFNIGSYPDSIKAYKQALSIEPTSARSHFGLGLVYIDLEENELAMHEHHELKDLDEDELAFQLLDKIQRQGKPAG
jgi:tetratricopeptide (TPR) repeat protein